MRKQDFSTLADTIPKDPGVYRFLDSTDIILYVGKAKNLRNRLASYFSSSKTQSVKTKSLVRNSIRFEFTITETEQDALLLENSLIKTHQPRYNVMLKDGKTYAYLCIKKEFFPRLVFTRKLIKDGSTYFGPYASKYKAELILELIKKLFPLRTCNLNLAPAVIDKGKYKVCLEYHIKNCMGPCQKFELLDDYNAKIQQIKNILNGHLKLVKQHLKEEMNKYAELLQFEKAQECKLKLDILEDYQGKSAVVSTSIQDVDVFSIASDEQEAYIHFMKIIDGAVVHTYTMEAIKNCDEDDAQILSLVIDDIREKFDSMAPEILVPFEVSPLNCDYTIHIPKQGDKKKLLDLSNSNIQYYRLQKRKEKIKHESKGNSADRILKTLQQELSMNELPVHIECFDNSNIHGAFPVAACVVFKNAKPSKKDYRHFNIKSVQGPNDFASMEEVVYRRYKRMLEENIALPQLIIIDGGKGQLSAACTALEKLNLSGKMTIVGIAKKLEEIYFPQDPVPLHINKKSESLKLIQQLRNEAHRFGISFHRNQRSRAFTKSELLNVKGIGEKTMQKILKKYGSIAHMKSSSFDELIELVGKDMALNIGDYFDFNKQTQKENP